jgi:hypothetical protein
MSSVKNKSEVVIGLILNRASVYFRPEIIALLARPVGR